MTAPHSGFQQGPSLSLKCFSGSESPSRTASSLAQGLTCARGQARGLSQEPASQGPESCCLASEAEVYAWPPGPLGLRAVPFTRPHLGSGQNRPVSRTRPGPAVGGLVSVAATWSRQAAGAYSGKISVWFYTPSVRAEGFSSWHWHGL
ncbi:hypothetical protein MATL_G00196550 [Megalops atlanticus]|uniref:Uncharacterized protein n=1 Tax=Megalops atlanticus TaxID=7932 RepID=A0A9D3PJL0_MEGAT|nr:hypothetical protein MATL_G00196550 [Megalops atlanticus]